MTARRLLSSAARAVFGAALAASPASAAFVVNGSFETAGATSSNSANWNELTSNAGNSTQRVSGNASAGGFAEELVAVGQANIGTSSTLQQITNQATPAGDVPTQGTIYTLSFDAKAVTFTGANLNYQLGFFVTGTGVTSITSGDRNNLVAGGPYTTITLASNPAPAGATGFFI